MTILDRTKKEKFKLKLNRKTCVSLCCLTVLVCFADIAAGGIEMSDAQKKNVVYRMYADYKKNFPAVSDISPHRAMELLNQETVVFVDIRRPEEIAVSILPGAVSKQDFLSHRDLYRDKIVVVYCTISYRSGVFAREMGEQGIRVVNLQGGILAWILEGGKVYDKSGIQVKRVHVYGDRWDYAPSGYQSVKFSFWQRMFEPPSP
jgi:sodium/bile acid cotransporter 7